MVLYANHTLEQSIYVALGDEMEIINYIQCIYIYYICLECFFIVQEQLSTHYIIYNQI